MGLAIGICIKYPGGGTWINATDIYIYIYCSMAGHLRMADTPAGGGQADVILRMGMHAYAMGEGGIWREPQRPTRRQGRRINKASTGGSFGWEWGIVGMAGMATR
jgi:hypothetical protein